MGKGDKKTTRGKIIQGSYGKTRPRKSGKPAVVVAEVKAPKAKSEKAEPKPKVAKAKVAKPETDAEKPKKTKKTEE